MRTLPSDEFGARTSPDITPRLLISATRYNYYPGVSTQHHVTNLAMPTHSLDDEEIGVEMSFGPGPLSDMPILDIIVGAALMEIGKEVVKSYLLSKSDGLLDRLFKRIKAIVMFSSKDPSIASVRIDFGSTISKHGNEFRVGFLLMHEDKEWFAHSADPIIQGLSFAREEAGSDTYRLLVGIDEDRKWVVYVHNDEMLRHIPIPGSEPPSPPYWA